MAAVEKSDLFAIILAGGASSRLHATSPRPTADKPLLIFQGKHVLTHVIEAAARRISSGRIVVVGPDSLPTGDIVTVYEHPPRSGPYMGVHTGLKYFTEQFGAASHAEGVLILGADMPRIALGIEHLFNHHNAATGVAIAQAGGRFQPLLSYVPRRLAEQLFGEPVVDAGLMRTLRACDHRVIGVPDAAVADLDTYRDALEAGITF